MDLGKLVCQKMSFGMGIPPNVIIQILDLFEIAQVKCYLALKGVMNTTAGFLN